MNSGLGFDGHYDAWCFRPTSLFEVVERIKKSKVDLLLKELRGATDFAEPGREEVLADEGRVVKCIKEIKRGGMDLVIKQRQWRRGVYKANVLERMGFAPHRATIANVARFLVDNGSLKWQTEISNVVCDAGINLAFDTIFGGGAQTDPWYMMVVDNDSFSAVAVGDLMNNHGGWIEWVAYDEGTRPAWVDAAAGSKIKLTTTPSDFTSNATDTLNGLALTTASDKSGTTGTLFSAGSFASTQAVASADILRASYTLTGSDQ